MKILKPHRPHSRFPFSHTAAPFPECSGTSDPVASSRSKVAKKLSSHNNSLFVVHRSCRFTFLDQRRCRDHTQRALATASGAQTSAIDMVRGLKLNWGF
ncbi:hypothetical protein M405DRAFT_540170 [Rhizopogon salebrosus TDB-379]|nr:hypothetical protein M405DRAFT_540170 [Rhizopogon salebrosus TDB-379]